MLNRFLKPLITKSLPRTFTPHSKIVSFHIPRHFSTSSRTTGWTEATRNHFHPGDIITALRLDYSGYSPHNMIGMTELACHFLGVSFLKLLNMLTLLKNLIWMNYSNRTKESMPYTQKSKKNLEKLLKLCL